MKVFISRCTFDECPIGNQGQALAKAHNKQIISKRVKEMKEKSGNDGWFKGSWYSTALQALLIH